MMYNIYYSKVYIILVYERENWFGNPRPKKAFFTLALPIIAFCIFDAIYGIVDLWWVSKINVDAFYAMGMSIPFVTFIFSVGDSIGQGTNSIMSRFIGSGIMKVHIMH